jgi:5-keto-L-gluconate epimerase
MMKLSCVISTPDVNRSVLAMFTGTFGERLAKAAGLGYEGVELMIRDPSLVDVQALLEMLGCYRLQVPQIVTGEAFMCDNLSLLHPDPAVCVAAMERLESFIRFAGLLGPGTIVNIGRLRGRLDWLPLELPLARALAIRTFQAAADCAWPLGVRVAIEPCNRYEVDFVQSTADALDVIAEIGRPNFGLMADVFHMNIEDVSIERGLCAAAPVLWHVHIADSNRLPPGSGHLDFAAIVAALRSIDYQGFLSVEARPLPDPDRAGQQTVEFMRPIMAGTRSQS